MPSRNSSQRAADQFVKTTTAKYTDDLRSCSIFPFPNEVPSDRSRLFLVFSVKRETPSCVGRIRGEKGKCYGNVYEEIQIA
jgi:hypothetical protein